MRNSWTKTGKGESTRANGQESSLLRYDNTQSILEEEGEYNLTERSNSNIPQLHISSSIQHNPSTEGVKELSSEQLASLKESFERFSSTKTLKKPARSRLNANGIREIMTSEPEVDITLSEKQLNQLFADASVPLHKATLTQIYANLSRAKPGKGVSFNDLLELMQQPNASQQTQTDYEQLFKMYDRKNRGFFDFQDYKYLCEGVAKQLMEAQLRAAFDAMDSEHEGRIVLGDSLIGYILYCTLMSDLQRLLFHDKFQKREKWFRLFENEVWTPRYNIDLPAQRSLAYQQLSQVAKSGIVSVRNFFDDPTNIFTAHEMLGTISASTSTKFTVHYNLFGGSIVALHTDRHKWIFDQIDSLAVTGCFCLTELGYGNNAVQMETTSTYDEKTKEFVIDCPTVVSQKYWITNGAVHANYALVFAQTYVKGKHEGVNAFLVPIRDKGLKALPGVEIDDMGIKIGLNGIDNAALKFHNVRVPRVNMMNKYADVDENGVFRSDVKGIQQRFFKVTERLLSGRLCIASMMLGGLKSAIYLSVKYYQQRKGVSPNGLSQTPIFDYQLQKNAVIPLVAKALALNMLHNYAKSVFANPKGHEDDLLITCCVDKAMMGWHGERTVSILRERSGGQGFLAANFFAEFIASAHAGITAEGDNKVLMIKVVKDLLSIYMKRQDYFYTGDFIKITEEKQLFCLQTLNKLFLMLEKFKLDRLITKMTNLKSSGKTNYEILMFQTSDETQELAYSHGEKLTFASCISSLQRLTDSKATVKNYFILFAWQVLQRQMSLLLLEGWICPNLAKNFKEIYNQQIKVAAKDIDVVIESLNIPVHALKVPIAKDYVKYNSYANLGEVVNAKL